MRLTSCVIAVTLVAFRGRSQVRRPLSRRPSGRLRGPLTEAREPPGLGTVAFLAIAAIGVTDALGEICFAGASAGGQLSIVSPLSSLYPAVTVLLAAAALRERVHPVQALGAAGALTGAVLLAL
jgi:drug/metabolite transporter (DMT)-like permease